MIKNVKMACVYGAPVNENFRTSDGWTCTLKYDGKQYTIPFYKGSGHGGSEPTVEEVLECLFQDANTADNARDFEDFASEMGYDSDSKKAEKIFIQCQRISDNLKRLFTSDYNRIMNGVLEY
jgi:hypothetical protein